jgi:hypothetical protein
MNCRGFDNAAASTFGMVGSQLRAVEGGWRMAWIVGEAGPELASVLTGPVAR